MKRGVVFEDEGVRLVFTVILMVVGLSVRVVAADTLTITYYAYPPKMAIIDGQPSGSRIDQMTAIAQAAGMKVRWVRMSPKEEANMLDAGQRKCCATGRSYSPERAKQWVFLPYYLDALSAHVVVARVQDADRIRKLGSIEAVLEDKGLRGILLTNYIYGPEVDPYLRANPSWIRKEANTVGQALDMVRAGRAHYTIAPNQYWQAYRKIHHGAKELVSIDKFGDMASNPLYIPCSRAIEPETIKALSEAMARLGYRPVDFVKLAKAP